MSPLLGKWGLSIPDIKVHFLVNSQHKSHTFKCTACLVLHSWHGVICVTFNALHFFSIYPWAWLSVILACLKLQVAKRWELDRGSWERPEEVTANVRVQRYKAFWVNSCLPLKLWNQEIVSSFSSCNWEKSNWVQIPAANKQSYVCREYILGT